MTSLIRTDHIGRPVFANNASGVKVWTAAYLPFGGVHTSTGTPITLRFPGQWFQSESGLYQNWMRDYDPATGRYLQADPLGLVDGASVYGYVRGNPGRWVDPRGEATQGALLLCVAGGPVNPACDAAMALTVCEMAIVGAMVAYEWWNSTPPIVNSSSPPGSGHNGGPPMGGGQPQGDNNGSGEPPPKTPVVPLFTPRYDDPNGDPNNWTTTTEAPQAPLKPNTTDTVKGGPTSVIVGIRALQILQRILGIGM